VLLLPNMDRTLRQHIEDLQQKLQVLTAQLMDEEPGKVKSRGELEAQLRAVESALTLYRSAFEIEARLLPQQKPTAES
jgi:hypothetical protein